MSLPRIYHPEQLADQSDVLLTANAANHVAKVLRMQPGEALIIFNGDGYDYAATIATINKREVRIIIDAAMKNNNDSPLQIHLLQAVARAEKMDWVVQKATELGVTSITPIITERCGVKLSDDRWEKRVQHWQAVSISACEQCGRNQLPQIHSAIHLPALLAQERSGALFILSPEAATPLTAHPELAKASIHILVGPEGGFSEQECKQAKERGYQPLKLGPRILRTETAPIVALSLFQGYFGDLG